MGVRKHGAFPEDSEQSKGAGVKVPAGKGKQDHLVRGESLCRLLDGGGRTVETPKQPTAELWAPAGQGVRKSVSSSSWHLVLKKVSVG